MREKEREGEIQSLFYVSYLSNKMLSLKIHEGFDGGDIAEKICNPRI